MRLVSLNVAMPRTVHRDGRSITSGIFKEPVNDRRWVSLTNITGDAQADLRVHGGEFKAVYHYPSEHYPLWARELGRDLPFGTFGENLTTEGMDEGSVHIGDVFRVGGVTLQVTQPRVPCFKLAFKMNDPHFPKRFLASGRSGFYARVVEEGELGAGDAIDWISRDPQQVAVRALHELAFSHDPDLALARQALAAQGLAPEWREQVEEVLARNA
jgi:MOSC domain-containing protein YiiM